MMENALRFPHTHSHGYDDGMDGGNWRSLGSFSNVRKTIDVTWHSVRKHPNAAFFYNVSAG